MNAETFEIAGLSLRRSTSWLVRILFGCMATMLAMSCMAESIELDAAPSYSAGLHIAYLKETDRILSLDDVRRPEVASQFIRNTSVVPSFGLTGAAYWFRLQLKNQHPTQSRWLIEIPTAMFWSAPYYVVRSDGSVEQGMIRHQGEAGFTSVPHPTPVFPLTLAPQQELTLYFRLQEKGSLRLPLTVWQPEAFVAAGHDRQFGGGLLFGVLLAMLVYNLLQYFALRDRNYAWYVGYISSLHLALASFLGYGKEYLWPQAAWWSSVSTLLCMALAVALGTAFAQSFLQTRRVLPRLHRSLTMLACLELGLGVLLVVLGRSQVINGAILLSSFFGTLLLFAVGLAALRAHVREARFFVAAWGAMLLSAALICLEHLGLIPVNPIAHQTLKISIALEGLLLSLALADRLQMLKRTRSVLRQLGARQERVREEQRKEIARDIHDKLGQNLLALRMDVGMLQGMTKGAFPRLDDTVERILMQIDSVVKNVRAIMNNLRPAMLDDLGLQAAIEWQVQEFQARSGIACELVSDGEFPDALLDEYRATVLFRSLQDALNGVFEQSGASRIEIDLCRRGSQLVMSMSDRHARAAFGGKAQASSLDLAGMRERLAALGGDFSLQSGPEQGLRLTITMPVQAQDLHGMVA